MGQALRTYYPFVREAYGEYETAAECAFGDRHDEKYRKSEQCDEQTDQSAKTACYERLFRQLGGKARQTDRDACFDGLNDSFVKIVARLPPGDSLAGCALQVRTAVAKSIQGAVPMKADHTAPFNPRWGSL